ncbi:hypothetical protein [Paraburkholderia sp. RL17-337-BIB-A]|uniref:hypothetical protein n=1 Tax=Paraburkholderia sp. RL17-337-BIB-A TaxID=3031636 RepID=UPI0038BB6DA9
MQTPLTHPNDNERINAEICKYGYPHFRSLRKLVFKDPTADTDAKIHKENRRRLLAKIAETIARGAYNPEIGIDEFWKLAWARIVYSGTLSSKASREIDSMQNFAPFRDFREAANGSFQLDKKQWGKFSDHWKDHFAGSSQFVAAAAQLCENEKTAGHLTLEDALTFSNDEKHARRLRECFSAEH